MKLASFLILVVAVIVDNSASEETPANNCPAWNVPGVKVLLPHPDDCEKYYKCVFGLPYLKSCPFVRGQQLRFNPKLKTCDWPWKVVCKDTITTTEEPEQTTPSSDACKGPHKHKIKDTTTCNGYYVCENSEVSQDLLCCSKGPFNEETQECETKKGNPPCTPWQMCA